MIIETKSYASVTDLKSLRFKCNKCGAELKLPFNADFERGVSKCPTCAQGWAVANNTSYVPEILDFVRATKNLVPQLKSMGFNLSIEVDFRSRPTA